MVETLVALSGAIGSGHRHLSQAADAVLDQAVAASGKPGVVWGYRHPSNRGNLEAVSDTTRPKNVKAKVGSETLPEEFLVDCGEENDSVSALKRGKLSIIDCREENDSVSTLKKGKLSITFCSMKGLSLIHI